jgi:hypothetical protein
VNANKNYVAYVVAVQHNSAALQLQPRICI